VFFYAIINIIIQEQGLSRQTTNKYAQVQKTFFTAFDIDIVPLVLSVMDYFYV